MQPPYRRIADELRDRIVSGDLGPGDRVPSVRRLVADEGVAMATATRALGVLRDQGWVESRPGVGTVVVPDLPAHPVAARAATAAGRRERPAAAGELTRATIVAGAVALADAEGLTAVSMRRVAAEIGTGTMSLYRHVPGKDDLLLIMREAVFGERPLPPTRPNGWRAQVELGSRSLWAIYRSHPWLARTPSLTRPLAGVNQLPYAEWNLSALSELGLGLEALFRLHLTLFDYVHGLAASLEAETEQRLHTGISSTDWISARWEDARAVLTSGTFPWCERVFLGLRSSRSEHRGLDLDDLFEFGLARLLDGFARLADQPE